MHIDYPELNCGGTVLLHQQIESAIEFNETLDRGTGACGYGGFIKLTLFEGDQWVYQWSSRRGAAPIVEGPVTLSFNVATSKPSLQAEVETGQTPDETATPPKEEIDTDAVPNAEPEMHGSHNFQISGHIGPLGSPDHLVVVTVIENEAFVEYPDLGCSGTLVIPDYVADVYQYLMENGSVSFTEIVQGPDCPTSGGMKILSWDGGRTNWMIERGGGTTGARPWMINEPATLEVGNISKPANQKANAQLPPGTVAADLDLGLFLGKGPNASSIVIAVEAGSPAAAAGIMKNDSLLIIDNGMGMVESHIGMMNAAIERDGRVEVHVQKASGERVVLTIHALSKAASDSELAVGNKMARHIYAGEFEGAYGFDKFDQRVRMAIEMRALVLLYVHERVYMETCAASISEPISAFESRLDLVTTQNGVEVDRVLGESETVRYRNRFGAPFLEAHANLSSPVVMISYMGPDYIGAAGKLVADAREIVTATGCESVMSEQFSNNLAAFVEQGTSLQ